MDVMISDCFCMILETSLSHSFKKYLLRAHPVPATKDTSCIRETKQLIEAKDAYNSLKVKYHTPVSGS